MKKWFDKGEENQSRKIDKIMVVQEHSFWNKLIRQSDCT